MNKALDLNSLQSRPAFLLGAVSARAIAVATLMAASLLCSQASLAEQTASEIVGMDAPAKLAVASVPADQTPASAQQLIQTAVDELVSAIEDAKKYYDTEPDLFHAEIDRILLPIVDFRSFARGVMGKYGSSRYQRSLTDDAERALFDVRVDRFVDRFKQGLVATYAKGLLAFEGERIEVVQPEKADKKGSVMVVQNIYTSGSDTIKIRYKMRQNKDKQWKVRNVQLQSVNLGKIYHNQFANAVKQYDGDIDKVIDNWVIESQGLEEEL